MDSLEDPGSNRSNPRASVFVFFTVFVLTAAVRCSPVILVGKMPGHHMDGVQQPQAGGAGLGKHGPGALGDTGRRARQAHSRAGTESDVA